MSFQEIPIIDLQEAFDPATRSKFLEEVRDAIINVGFLLLKNYESLGPTEEDLQSIKQQAIEFFALPAKEKLQCEMLNSPHFLGYTRLANEITASHTDWREQIDLATELPAPKEGEPLYKNIEGPNLWPNPEVIPKFRPTIERFIEKMTALSNVFKDLVAESIGVDPKALNRYFKENQHVKKINCLSRRFRVRWNKICRFRRYTGN